MRVTLTVRVAHNGHISCLINSPLFLETGFVYVYAAFVVLELTLQARLASNS